MGTLRHLVALVCSSLLITGSPANSQSGESITVELKPLKKTAVRQGIPFKFVLQLTNHSSTSQAAAGALSIDRVATDPNAVRFLHWSRTVPANSTTRETLEVNPPQWFAERGPYRIELVSDRLEAEPLDFDVVRSPVQVPRFKDVTEEVGLTDSIGPYSCGLWTAGAAWADVDGDGRVDLFLPRRDEPARLWINDGTTFRDEAETRGVAHAGPMTLGAAFADYDDDGDQDLYVANEGNNILFANDGSGHFEDVTESAGVGNEGPTQSASWADYDMDGDLDLYTVNYFRCPLTEAYRDALYRNNGDGSFTDVTELLEVTGTTDGPGYQAAWFDFDRDRDVDLYLGNDFWGKGADPNHLWRNDSTPGGDSSFTDVSQATGTGISINTMGLGVGDFDRDLDLDVVLSNIRAVHLLRNNRGTFSEVGTHARVGLWNQDASTVSVTWGAEFIDLNNNGWEDLYIAAAPLSSGETFQPNHLFTNQRNGRFLDHRAPSGADDAGASRAVVPADFDRDGRMDLYVVNNDGGPRLFKNITPRKKKRWLQVELTGTESAKDACGATVIVKLRKARLMKQLFCGGTSLGSSTERTIHFGLGRSPGLRKVIVWWPVSGRQVFNNIGTNRRVQLIER